ncbi:MAG: tetratricopeptide repeat protein, partial [Proteobacteria bacterium]
MANKPTQASINPEFVERYQLELNKNPRSRVFAPLAEAYRKMGLLEEAKRICRFGTQAHPDFAGGHVAYAKVLLDLKNPGEALKHLEAAAKLSPDNLLAHNLLGETLIEVRRPKEALKAFKMVLFLDPDNARATQAVRKWEFLTADEYSEDVFAMKPIFKDESAKDEAVDEELQDLLTESGFTPSNNIKDMR